jgi:L-aspartate oxidase
MYTTDVLIIGAGIAGLTTAIKIAEERPDLKITVFTKTVNRESNTKYAQGGVAAVWNHQIDSYQKHIEDTLDAGDGLCDSEVVSFVVKEGPLRVQEIIDWGARFDKEKGSEVVYNLGREGGHSENRILHFKDLTGWEMQRTLSDKAASLPNIEMHEHFFAIDLITQHHLGHNITRLRDDIKCYGAYVLDTSTRHIEMYLSKITVLATGGCGQIYRNTTNPIIATGDGIAMMYRAKGRISNMEFVQFHPTALYNPSGDNPSFLISEAVRGFGAILRRTNGEEFMHEYDNRLSLAPRDIVARAIDSEMKKRGEDFVYLDCTHLDHDGFLAHFPTIYEKCKSIGIDAFKDYMPVTPACHYMCGGVKIDHHGQSSIHQLYACGECTSSGLHGANRLASNSLLEAMVYGHRIYEKIVLEVDQLSVETNIPEWNADGTTRPKELVLLTQSQRELKEIMSSYVGIVRSNVRLKRAIDRLHLLYKETEKLYQSSIISPQLCELRNLITIGYLVTRSAAMRSESRGLHYTTDFPAQHNFSEDTLM